MPIDHSSIMSKLQMGTMSDGFKRRNASVVRGVTKEKAIEATSVLADCIESALASSGLSGGAISAVGEISTASPEELVLSDGAVRYISGVFIGEESRPSLAPEEYGSVGDMAALFNNGVDHTMNRVFGKWHGVHVRSKTEIPQTHFVQIGVDNFNGNYGYEFSAVAEVSSGRFS